MEWSATFTIYDIYYLVSTIPFMQYFLVHLLFREQQIIIHFTCHVSFTINQKLLHLLNTLLCETWMNGRSWPFAMAIGKWSPSIFLNCLAYVVSKICCIFLYLLVGIALCYLAGWMPCGWRLIVWPGISCWLIFVYVNMQEYMYDYGAMTKPQYSTTIILIIVVLGVCSTTLFVVSLCLEYRYS